jgi:hypothetical protein
MNQTKGGDPLQGPVRLIMIGDLGSSIGWKNQKRSREKKGTAHRMIGQSFLEQKQNYGSAYTARELISQPD